MRPHSACVPVQLTRAQRGHETDERTTSDAADLHYRNPANPCAARVSRHLHIPIRVAAHRFDAFFSCVTRHHELRNESRCPCASQGTNWAPQNFPKNFRKNSVGDPSRGSKSAPPVVERLGIGSRLAVHHSPMRIGNTTQVAFFTRIRSTHDVARSCARAETGKGWR